MRKTIYTFGVLITIIFVSHLVANSDSLLNSKNQPQMSEHPHYLSPQLLTQDTYSFDKLISLFLQPYSDSSPFINMDAVPDIDSQPFDVGNRLSTLTEEEKQIARSFGFGSDYQYFLYHIASQNFELHNHYTGPLEYRFRATEDAVQALRIYVNPQYKVKAEVYYITRLNMKVIPYSFGEDWANVEGTLIQDTVDVTNNTGYGIFESKDNYYLMMLSEKPLYISAKISKDIVEPKLENLLRSSDDWDDYSDDDDGSDDDSSGD